MPVDERSVTVVIPSRGRLVRADALWRAVTSVLTQEHVQAVPLVVLNGEQEDPSLPDALQGAGARVLVQHIAGLPEAHRAGRAAVDTPWFATLDDDDLLLPGALSARVALLEANPAVDVVVSNGLVNRDGRDTLHIGPELDVGADPLRAMRRKNWLLPGSWLARTERVTAAVYDGMPRYLECTFLALRFANEFRMVWLAEPTIRYSHGSPGAESQSDAYRLGQVDALRALLKLPLPAWYRREVERDVSAAYHDAANFFREAGRLRAAWAMYVRSLASAGGLRFLPFGRHLVFDALAGSRS